MVDISDLLSIYQKWSTKINEIYGINNWFIQNFYFEDENYIYKDTDDKNKNFLNILFNDIDDEKFIEENLIIKEIDSKLNSNETVIAHKLCGAGNGGFFLVFSEKDSLTIPYQSVKINVESNGVVGRKL